LQRSKVDKVLSEKSKDADQPILIKKYANRRLYNTATSSYVTLDHLCTMVKGGETFVVEDAKTGEDITRSVLTQIIFEEEGKGENLLPINFLRQLIGFYGDNLQPVVPQYLEMTMESFSKNQEAMRENLGNVIAGSNPFTQFEEVARQNVNLFQQAMSAFAPFQMPGVGGVPGMGGGSNGATAAPAAEEPAVPTGNNSADADDLSSLKDKLADLERQIGKLSEK
jgi:polyhydroxyalkanoate synthesis repressor PhaR